MREAREAWLHVTEKIGGNPSSMHQAGTQRQHRARRRARKAGGVSRLQSARHHLDERRDRGEQHGDAPFRQEARADGKDFGSPPSSIRACTIRRNIISASARKLIPVTRDGVVDMDWLTAELADERPGLVARDGREQRDRHHPAVARKSSRSARLTKCRSSPMPCSSSARCRAKDWAIAIMSAARRTSSAGRAAWAF